MKVENDEKDIYEVGLGDLYVDNMIVKNVVEYKIKGKFIIISTANYKEVCTNDSKKHTIQYIRKFRDKDGVLCFSMLSDKYIVKYHKNKDISYYCNDSCKENKTYFKIIKKI